MIIKLKYHILVDNAEMAKCGAAKWLNSPVDNNTLTQDQYLDLYQPLTHAGLGVDSAPLTPNPKQFEYLN